MRRVLTLKYWQDDGWFVGHLQEVPGVCSQGESLEELEENIQDAYSLMLMDSAPPVIAAEAHQKAIELEL